MQPHGTHRSFATMLIALVCSAAAISGACSTADDDSVGDSSRHADTSAGGDPIAAGADLRVQELVSGLDRPVDVVAVTGTGSVLVAEQPGIISLVDLNEGASTPTARQLLDLSDRVESSGNEQGLLGLAVSPDSTALYVSYTSAGTGASQLDEYRLDHAHDSSTGSETPAVTVDPSSRRALLSVEQPYPNHNGCDLAIGPDGMLYWALGDGGGAGDPDANAQDPTSMLGKLLRLDPTRPDLVPADNPFVGHPTARPEIWSLGLRNPWRIDFDHERGDLWIADVGQNRFEEVNLVTGPGAGRGANFGWSAKEGHETFDTGSPSEPDEGQQTPTSQPMLGDLVAPIHVYGRDDGCSITGGVVLPDSISGTGTAAPAGSYLFADLCRSGIRALVPDGEDYSEVRFDLPLEQVVGFGLGDDGQVLVVSISGSLSQILGA